SGRSPAELCARELHEDTEPFAATAGFAGGGRRGSPEGNPREVGRLRAARNPGTWEGSLALLPPGPDAVRNLPVPGRGQSSPNGHGRGSDPEPRPGGTCSRV